MEKIKKLKEYWWLITLIIGIFSSLFLTLHNVLNKIDDTYDTVKTTQQMALKSVIWNEEIPIAERASACDTYLNAGYNSLTKKECEKIIEKGVSDGIFSYVEKEVKNNEYSNNFSNDYSRYYSTILYAY